MSSSDFALPILSPGSFRAIIAIDSAIYALSLIAAVLRVYSRVRIVKSWGTDDTLMVISALLYTGTTVCGVTYCLKVENRTILSQQQINDIVGLLLSAESLYSATMITLKVSLAITFIRILNDRVHVYQLYAVALVTILFGVAILFVNIFQCGTPQGGLQLVLDNLNNNCLPKSVIVGMNWAHGLINAITDVLLVGIPLSVTLKLQMRRKEKIVLAILFVTAGMGTTMSIIRLFYVNGASAVGIEFFKNSKMFLFWSTAEAGVGILVGCVLTLRRLFRQIFNTSLRIMPYSNEPLRSTRYPPVELQQSPQSRRGSAAHWSEQQQHLDERDVARGPQGQLSWLSDNGDFSTERVSDHGITHFTIRKDRAGEWYTFDDDHVDDLNKRTKNSAMS